MGNVRAHRGLLASALIFTVLVALALFGAMLTTDNASAQPTFTTCAGCHAMAATHANANHASLGCSTCHATGTATPPLPNACGKCHGGVTNILKSTQHVANACGTTVGCHGYTAPGAVTTTMTAKVAPTSVKVKKSVKVTGTAGPAASLAGAKVALKVDRKVGTKWTKMKTGTATVTATGTYTWSYKTAKKGAHRVTVSIAKSATHTAKTLVKTFKVK